MTERYKAVITKTRRSKYFHSSRYPGFRRNRSVKRLEWARSGLTEAEARGFENLAREDRLLCSIYPERYERSSGYRAEYIAAHPGPWRCRYCHRKLWSEAEMTVDHIVPVAAVKDARRPIRREAARWMLEREGAVSVNDDANLCPACKGCNSSKGQKLGLWTIAGILGRHEAWWVAVRIVQAAVVAAAVAAVAAFGPSLLGHAARAARFLGIA